MSEPHNFELQFKQDGSEPMQSSPKLTVQTLDNTKQTIMPFNLQMCLLALLFKLLAILLYFVLKYPAHQDILTFVMVVLMSTFDFWVTKNLTGRKLVGLRWWSEFNSNDQQEWVFESCQPNRILNEINANVFWAAQFMIVLFWTILTLVNIIMMSMFWTSLAVFGFLMSAINLYCYFKCRGEHRKKIRALASRVGINFMMGQTEN